MKISKIYNILSFIIFIIGTILAFFFDEFFRIFIRSSFGFFNGDFIQFTGKNFHIFATYAFSLIFGIFLLLSFLIITKSKRKTLTAITIIFIFLILNLIISYIESKLWVMECTTCENGIRKINYNELPYTNYLLISSIITILISHLLKKTCR